MIDAAAVDALRDVLLSGGVALVPTDTVYGLAAALDVPRGVEALYALKGRPRSQPCQVLLYDRWLVDEALEDLAPPVAAAARALLPGPATCIVPDPTGRYRAATGDAAGSVGIRAPRTSGTLAALGALRVALVATSANDPGGPDPRTVGDVPTAIRAGVALVVDAGPLPGTASAVVDLTGAARGEARLLRPGPDPQAVETALMRQGVAVVRRFG